jgi:hypothetical protein
VILDAASKGLAALAATAPRERRIGVWFADDATGRLMLLCAYFMTRCAEWRHAHILLLTAPADVDAAEERLRAMLAEVRIDAEPVVVPHQDARAIATRSGAAALVFLPFQLRGEKLLAGFGLELEDLVAKLPLTAFVQAAEDLALDAAPEEGPQAELAELVEAARELVARSSRAEEAARAVRQSRWRRAAAPRALLRGGGGGPAAKAASAERDVEAAHE